MKVLLKMIAALLITKAKLIGPGGTEAFVTDSRHIKQQILFINRSGKAHRISCYWSHCCSE